MSESGNFTTRILKKLFPKKNSNEPLVSGKLKRSEKFTAQYESWRKTHLAEKISELQRAYNKSNAHGLYNPAFHVYNSDQSNGFFFNYHMDFRHDEFSFLLDNFRDRVVEMGYNLYTSDTKFKDTKAGVQQIDRHYLKPAQEGEEMPMDQKYGNVLIELFSLDNNVQYLKLMANIYSDRSFSEARPFSEFMELLFNDATK